MLGNISISIYLISLLLSLYFISDLHPSISFLISKSLHLLPPSLSLPYPGSELLFQIELKNNLYTALVNQTISHVFYFPLFLPDFPRLSPIDNYFKSSLSHHPISPFLLCTISPFISSFLLCTISPLPLFTLTYLTKCKVNFIKHTLYSLHKEFLLSSLYVLANDVISSNKKLISKITLN
jgi:hypothetical protein